jgi:hypothetical protein
LTPLESAYRANSTAPGIASELTVLTYAFQVLASKLVPYSVIHA